MQVIQRSEWLRAALCAALLLVGFFIVGHWCNAESAALLLLWLPVLHGLATLVAGRREIVEQLRRDARWFAVSRPKSYEHGFGYGRVFEWSEELARYHAGRDYSKEGAYYFDIRSGSPWYSGGAFGQSLDFNLGVRSNVLELPASEAKNLSAICRAYEAATAKCGTYFVIGWVVAVIVPFFLSFKQTLIALGIAAWIVVWWGVLPKWSLRDRTRDHEFLCPSHIHVYTYFPGDGNSKAGYYCVCGRAEKARDESLED